MWLASGSSNSKEQWMVRRLGSGIALAESLLPELLHKMKLKLSRVTDKRCKSHFGMKSWSRKQRHSAVTPITSWMESLLLSFSGSLKLNNTKPRIKFKFSTLLSWTSYYQCTPEFGCGLYHQALSQDIPGHVLTVRAVPIRQRGEPKIMSISPHSMESSKPAQWAFTLG